MRKAFLLLVLLQPLCLLAWGQHYQRVVNDVTACSTFSCVEALLKKTKALDANKPVKKGLGLDTQRILVDFELPYKKKSENKLKSYRLSLLIHQDKIYFGQLDQLEGTKLETSYLFKNDVNFLESHVSAYNSQNKTANTYSDLVESITSREPRFWLWRE